MRASHAPPHVERALSHAKEALLCVSQGLVLGQERAALMWCVRSSLQQRCCAAAWRITCNTRLCNTRLCNTLASATLASATLSPLQHSPLQHLPRNMLCESTAMSEKYKKYTRPSASALRMKSLLQPAYDTTRQHTSAHVSISQHTSV
jgi:hypothetical protein